MAWVEVKNEAGEVVWSSPNVEVMGVDQVANTVKVLDIETSLVVAFYRLDHGDKVIQHEETKEEEEEVEVKETP